MIDIEHVTKRYHEGQPNEVVAVRDLSLALPMGRVSVLQGPSGSGKTTLLSLIGGVARPTEGRIRLNGEPISGLPEHHLAEVRRRCFGIVFQRFNLISGLSALDNVMLPAYPLGLPHRELVARAQAVMARLSIQHRARTGVELLSGGEMQRVAIARALINGPTVLIADEPTASLDTRLAGQFLDIVAGLAAEGTTIVIATHDPRIIEAPVVGKVVRMVDGQIVDADPC